MKLRHLFIMLPMLFGSATAIHAQVSVGIGLPGINIGINMPVYPRLVLVPGYPVYYDPYVNANYFFYDGMYWVYQDDNWYASSWYNGPWQLVDPFYVPEFLLRIPVRYYHRPPPYFRNWRADAPPHWGEHWGRDWEARRSGWNRWDHRAAPRPAPLPNYQRQYSEGRYPRDAEQQRAIRSEQYRYQPHEAVTRQHFEQQGNRGDAHLERGQQAPQMSAPRIEQRPQPMQAPQMDHRERDRYEPRERNGDNRGEERGGENRREEHGQDRR
ncbi:MAG TPA: hypothetical protein VIF82_09060 [Burkholderiaceae bacterium]|jgi:hypothetical protein